MDLNGPGKLGPGPGPTIGWYNAVLLIHSGTSSPTLGDLDPSITVSVEGLDSGSCSLCCFSHSLTLWLCCSVCSSSSSCFCCCFCFFFSSFSLCFSSFSLCFSSCFSSFFLCFSSFFLSFSSVFLSFSSCFLSVFVLGLGFGLGTGGGGVTGGEIGIGSNSVIGPPNSSPLLVDGGPCKLGWFPELGVSGEGGVTGGGGIPGGGGVPGGGGSVPGGGGVAGSEIGLGSSRVIGSSPSTPLLIDGGPCKLG